MARIVVLGAGLVGSVMAEDLSIQHEVTSVDISKDNLDKLSGIKQLLQMFLILIHYKILLKILT